MNRVMGGVMAGCLSLACSALPGTSSLECQTDDDCVGSRICNGEGECVYPSGTTQGGSSSGGAVTGSSSRSGSSSGTSVSGRLGAPILQGVNVGTGTVANSTLCHDAAVTYSGTAPFSFDGARACPDNGHVFLRVHSLAPTTRCFVYVKALAKAGSNGLNQVSGYLYGPKFMNPSGTSDSETCLAPDMYGWVKFYGTSDVEAVDNLEITEADSSDYEDYQPLLGWSVEGYARSTDDEDDILITVRNTGTRPLELSYSQVFLLDSQNLPIWSDQASPGTDSYLDEGTTATLVMRAYGFDGTASRLLVYPDVAVP